MKTYNLDSSFKLLEINASDLRQLRPGEIISAFNSCGLIFCTQGSVTVDFDDKRYVIHNCEFLVYMPSSSAKIIDQDADFKGFIIESYIEYVLPIINKLITIGCLICLRQRPTTTLTDEQFELIQNHINNLISCFEKLNPQPSNNPCDILNYELLNTTAHTLVYEVLLFYFTNQPIIEVNPSKSDIVFYNFIISIYRNYTKERNVAFYAKEQNMNPRYFSTVIKKTSGENAHSWITRMVIAEAKQKLSRTDLSIKEISFLMSFPSQTFFGKYFKQYTGMSPKDYRNQKRLF